MDIDKAVPFPIESGYPIMTSNIEGQSYTLKKLVSFKEFIKLFWVHDQKERRVLWNIYEDYIKRDDYKTNKLAKQKLEWNDRVMIILHETDKEILIMNNESAILKQLQ